MQIVEHDVRLTASDGFPLRAFGARPDGAIVGGLVVLHEIFGITEYVKEVVRYFAQAGFHAVAPSLFDRQNHLAGFGLDDADEGRALADGADRDAVIADIRAARDLVGMRTGAGLVGFCWGGGLAYLAACEIELTSAVGFYPTRLGDYLNGTPRCPLQFHISETDKHTPPDLRQALSQRAPEAQIHLYGADHGFDNSTRPIHNPEASVTARQRAVEFTRIGFGVSAAWRPFEKDVAFLGFGETGRSFVDGWRTERRVSSAAFDPKMAAPGVGDEMRAACEERDVQVLTSPDEAPATAPVVIAAVTADQAVPAAESVASVMTDANLYLDLSTVAPAVKRAAASVITATGARYVDAAIMGPPTRRLHRTPLLLSGPDAAGIVELLESWNMEVEVISDTIGDAATVRMVRSVFVKGLESVVAECAVAAESAGVFEKVFSSLNNLRLGTDMTMHAGQLLQRVIERGPQRAAEMREVAQTLQDLGVSSYTSHASAAHLQMVADMQIGGGAPVGDDARVLAQAILAGIRRG